MRPLYETPAHLTTEQRIAQKLEHFGNCTLQKLPLRYHLDYAMKRDNIVGFCEIKTTKYQMDTHASYGGFKLSLAKWCHAKQMCDMADVFFVLAVGFPEGVHYLKTKDFAHDGVVWWGRQDRGDAQDMEPAIKLKIERFRPI